VIDNLNSWIFCLVVANELQCAVGACIIDDENTVDELRKTPERFQDQFFLVECRYNHRDSMKLIQDEIPVDAPA
jgi:hypothetical protein